MDTKESVMTRKGQVTVPIEMRQELGLEEGDRIAFTLVGEEIRLRRSASVVASTAGAFKGYGPVLTAEELREAAEEAMAEEATERAGG